MISDWDHNLSPPPPPLLHEGWGTGGGECPKNTLRVVVLGEHIGDELVGGTHLAGSKMPAERSVIRLTL